MNNVGDGESEILSQGVSRSINTRNSRQNLNKTEESSKMSNTQTNIKQAYEGRDQVTISSKQAIRDVSSQARRFEQSS